jgi:hypothetical protein
MSQRVEAGSRAAILRQLNRKAGRLVDAGWLRTSKPLGPTHYVVHPLIRGIHKPRGELLVASVLISMDSPYRDEVIHRGKAWCVVYHRQAGPASQWDNTAMAATVGQQLGVIQQVCLRPKPSYLVLGVGQLVAFDAENGLALVVSPSFQTADGQ